MPDTVHPDSDFAERLLVRFAKRTSGATPDAPTSARAAGLRYVCDQTTSGIRRLGRPGRFRYAAASGRRITNKQLAAAAGFASQREAKRQVVKAIESVARSLGNTKTV